MALLPESHGRARALAPTKRVRAGRRIVERYMSVIADQSMTKEGVFGYDGLRLCTVMKENY